MDAFTLPKREELSFLIVFALPNDCNTPGIVSEEWFVLCACSEMYILPEEGWL
jgi:hypothetical protein